MLTPADDGFQAASLVWLDVKCLAQEHLSTISAKGLLVIDVNPSRPGD